MSNVSGKSMFSGRAARVIVIGVLAFALGYIFRGGGREAQIAHQHDQPAQEQARVQTWTCSMHPQIRQPNPGQCPLCGMDLIPVSSGEDEQAAGPRQLKLSETARKLAEIQVAPVERKFVTAEIRMVGKIDYDETRLGTITAWIPGRLDRLFVDYTGIPVRKGDHLVSLYSPELLSAQEELLQALKAAETIERSGLARSRETARRTIESAREKLRLWGLTQGQITEIERRGESTDHMTIYAPMSGIVIHKNAIEGMYVNTGSKIYTIADLSHVWVKLDAYESDLAWIRYGQEVEFHTEAHPGETFKGRIAFIDPILDVKTRTAKVRVNVPNPDGKLKPGMFVRARVHADVAAGGAVMASALAGKWICPMHPGVIKEGPGSCDICGMPLERPESLGYESVDRATAEVPLVIPASAPLITGRRAVVYVADPEKEGTYDGREVVLGPRAGDYYSVRQGLEEGELVVVNGNFKIDSAVQILAKPSMMSPEGGVVPAGHDHHGGPPPRAGDPHREKPAESYDVPYAFREQVDRAFSAYFETHRGLSQDSLGGAQLGAKRVLNALAAVDMSLLEGPAHMEWMKQLGDLNRSAGEVAGAEEIDKARDAFAPLSDSLCLVAKTFGTTGREPIFRFHCSMAFDGRGAYWLQNRPDTENPYYGEAMLKCGEQTETISPGPGQKYPEGHEHE